MRDKTVQVTLPYACFGIVLVNGVVDMAPPIAHWMLGKTEHEVAAWVARKGGRGVVLS